MTSLEVAKYVYEQLMRAGATSEGACAVLGNLQAESGFVPNNLENQYNNSLKLTDEEYTSKVDNGSYTNFVRDSAGYGLAQWTYWSRKQNLLNYCKANNKSIGDLEAQTNFLIKEMKENYSSIWSKLTTSKDLYDLTWIVLDKWENPYTKNITTRYAYSQNWYNQLNDTYIPDTNITQDQAIKKVLDTARNELGYHEKASNSQLNDKTANAGCANYTKYARDLDAVTNFYNGAKNGYAWCDVFTDWLFYYCFGADAAMKMLCQPQKSAGAGCSFSAGYYKSAGKWSTKPGVGYQIFFSYSTGEVSHTGIVEEVTDTQVITIEGNSGDQVARRKYNINDSKIYGYGCPRWEYATNNITLPTNPSTPVIILSKGSKGKDVKKLQENLISLGYNCGPDGADGDFGNNTLNAVIKFQKDHNLEQDGEVGPLTKAALEKALKEKEEANTIIKVGDRVKVKAGSTYYDGKTKIPQFVLNDTWIVYYIKNDRVIIDKNIKGTYSIMSPINIKNLTKVNE